jgi:hypothetical protein
VVKRRERKGGEKKDWLHSESVNEKKVICVAKWRGNEGKENELTRGRRRVERK